MNEFVYAYPTKTYLGEESVAKAFQVELGKYGNKVLLAYGGGSVKKNGIYQEITTLLRQSGKEIVDFGGIMPNPTYAKVQEGATLAKKECIDLIVAVGGGSVIDCCKIISAQAKSERDIWELEFTDHKLPTEFIPICAVVTVSGTGAEQNNGAVITNKEKKLKCGVWGASVDFAVLNPAYTRSVPFQQVISGAFDTLSHCMETYFGSPREDNLSDEINVAVMRSVIRNIRLLLRQPDDLSIRSELMWASAMAENGILKIGKVTDFQAHQIEHQLGAYTDCNHGCGLAVLHPILYRHIYSSAVTRFAHFAQKVWGVHENGQSEKALALAGIQALEDFIKEIGLPASFQDMGIIDNTCFTAIADSTNLTVGCCKKLTKAEVLDILYECYARKESLL